MNFFKLISKDGKKIFVSYKYSDSNVASLDGSTILTTVRHYVNELDDILKDSDHLYKGEDDDEDLSHLKEETIQEKLKDRIYDSTLTIVLVSKGMKENRPENLQWIPREVSYSLKETTRGGRTSSTNAILGIVLPDRYGEYDYFMEYKEECNSTTFKTSMVFPILEKNMFNRKNPDTRECQGSTIHMGRYSYFHCIRWKNFIEYPDYYIDLAYQIYEERDQYNITKTLETSTF